MQRNNSVSRGIKKDMVLAHDYYFPIIHRNLELMQCREKLNNYYYLGFGKNLYYSLIAGVLNSPDFKHYKELYNSIETTSIYHKKEYKEAIKHYSVKYGILDRISRIPFFYYMIFKALSKFIHQ